MKKILCIFFLTYSSLGWTASYTSDGLVVDCKNEVKQLDLYYLQESNSEVDFGAEDLNYEQRVDYLFNRITKKQKKKLVEVRENLSKTQKMLVFLNGQKLPPPSHRTLLPKGCTLERLSMFVAADPNLGEKDDRIMINENLFMRMSEADKAAFLFRENYVHSLRLLKETYSEEKLKKIMKSYFSKNVEDNTFYIDTNAYSFNRLDFGKVSVASDYYMALVEYKIFISATGELGFSIDEEYNFSTIEIENYKEDRSCKSFHFPKSIKFLNGRFIGSDKDIREFEYSLMCQTLKFKDLKLKAKVGEYLYYDEIEYKRQYRDRVIVFNGKRQYVAEPEIEVGLEGKKFLLKNCNLMDVDNYYALSARNNQKLCQIQDEQGKLIFEGWHFYYDFSKEKFLADKDFKLNEEVEIQVSGKRFFASEQVSRDSQKNGKFIFYSKRKWDFKLQFDHLNSIDMVMINSPKQNVEYVIDYLGQIISANAYDDDILMPKNKINTLNLPNGKSIQVIFTKILRNLKFESASSGQLVGYEKGFLGLKLPVKLEAGHVYEYLSPYCIKNYIGDEIIKFY